MKWMLMTLGLALLLAGCTAPDDGGDRDGDDLEPGTPQGPEEGSEGGTGSEETPASGSFEIAMDDFSFEPTEVWVEAGTGVTWNNHGEALHTATADDGSFDTGDVDGGDTSEPITLDEEGSFPYVCIYHDQMTATIHVVS